VLNIGVLAPGAGEYYIGEVATSAEDYYSGRGETAGRWVGSLAAEIGLSGEVDSDAFRAVLAGRHPGTGEQLVQRNTMNRVDVSEIGPDRLFDVPEAAAVLGVSTRQVRRLLETGDAYRAALDAADGDEVTAPGSFLTGVRVAGTGRQGPAQWRVTGGELQRLVASRPERKPRPGFDLTLRPPKSVSVLWALGGPQVAAEVRAAHTAAVDEVVAYYERHGIRSRAKGSGRRVVTDGMIAAAFDHRTSRAGDPLLHTHVVTANMTRFGDRHGNEVWRAVEGPAVFEHARSAGYLYQAHLRHELAGRLGVQFHHPVHGYAEIIGVPDAVVEQFSKRRNEIEDLLTETGGTSARAAQVATLETRKAKDYTVDADTLTDRWHTEAAAVGFGRIELLACLGHDRDVDWWNPELEAEVFDMLAGPRGLCERGATFTRATVVEHLAILTESHCSAGDIDDAVDRFLASSRVLRVAEHRHTARRGPGQERWTTIEMAEIEQRVLRLAALDVADAAHLVRTADGPVTGDGDRMLGVVTRTGAAVTAGLNTDRSPVTSRLNGGLNTASSAGLNTDRLLVRAVGEGTVERVVLLRPELSDEQADMVRQVCRSDRFVLTVEGRPGAGKTYATDAVVAAHVAAGVPIIGCAVSAAAAAELESQAGFARSVMPAATVAKVLIDCDAHGGLAAGATVVVDEASMIATRDLARLAVHAARVGGRIVLVGDPDQHGAVEAGGMFAHLCRVDGDELVRLVENRRQDDHTDRLAIDDYRNGLIAQAMNRLDGAHRVIRSATAAESMDAMVADWYAAHRHGGTDPMIAGPNSTRRALNDRARILLKAAGELSGDPLEVGGREYLLGDLVVARRNDRTLRPDRGSGFVKNGSAGVIVAIDHMTRDVTVRFDTDGTIRVPYAYLAAGHLEHGYARTTYGVQGHTHDVGRYHPSDASSFEEGYVAITRARQGTKVYVIDGPAPDTGPPDLDPHTGAGSRAPRGLDDVTAALGRRRANAMAADATPDLDRVAHIVDTRSLADIHRRRRRLDVLLASAPPDKTTLIADATGALNVLEVRRDRYLDNGRQVPAALQQRIGSVAGTLADAEAAQADRKHWHADHADEIDDHRVLIESERTIESRIRSNPTANLPRHVRNALGARPGRQRERTAWDAAVTAVAIHHARHEPHLDHLGYGIEALLGPRPTDADAAASWNQAARQTHQLGQIRGVDIDDGAGIEL